MEFKNISQPVFDNWYIEERIGSGSFGTVYKIKREEFGITYYSALKVIDIPSDSGEINTLRSEGMDDLSITSYYREVVQELLNEIKILDSLKGNSNIVSYEDHKIISDDKKTKFTILIRMELLMPLKDYLVKNKVSEEDVAKLGADLCNALKLCEKNNIIHRDIKPDNIFVSKNGDFKLGDFGVARIAEKVMSQMSRKGTYGFMSPEVYQNKPYDNRADIYSLGLVLYQLLNNNRAPFLPAPPANIKFSDREKAMERRFSGEPIPALNLKNRMLEKTVLKACNYDIEKRYSCADEFFNDLTISISKGNEAMNEFDTEKTVSPFDNSDYYKKKQADRDEPKKEVDLDATVSPFHYNKDKFETDLLPAEKKNTPLDSFRLFFKKYVDFKGRTGRSDYWNCFLINIMVFIILSVLSAITGPVGMILLLAYLVAVLIPGLAISVRRLHDIGKKGTYLLLGLIPVAGAIVLIVWFTKDSQHENGNHPKYN